MTQIHGDAIFSPCGTYRVRLDRWWSDRPRVAFGLLNPSTAGKDDDDPTSRRLIGFCRDWGLGGYSLFNAHALISTDPEGLYTHPDPIGPENDRYILEVARSCCAVIVGWGVHGKFMDRGEKVVQLLKANGIQPLSFGKTKEGFPRHPLYLPRTATPSPYHGRAA
jgi:hypothetical protein